MANAITPAIIGIIQPIIKNDVCLPLALKTALFKKESVRTAQIQVDKALVSPRILNKQQPQRHRNDVRALTHSLFF